MSVSPFHFYTKLDQTLLLGSRARNIAEMLDGVRTVPGSSIYYHTHRFLQQHHYLSPEPPNDFAYWVTEVLNNAMLGERLSSIDTVQFSSIADLRERLVEIIASYMKSEDEGGRCPPGEEFHFMASQTFALQTPYVAHSLGEFSDILQRVSVSSLYYHMFDARLRLEQGQNDFSRWFEELGRPELAQEVRQLDPYTYTLEGLRKRLLVLVRKYEKH